MVEQPTDQVVGVGHRSPPKFAGEDANLVVASILPAVWRGNEWRVRKQHGVIQEERLVLVGFNEFEREFGD